MPEIPAWCSHCHNFTPSGIVVEGSVHGLCLSGNKVTCAHCGQSADIIEGTFDIEREVLHVLAAPGWTLKRLRQLQKAAERAQKLIEEQRPTEAVAAVREVDARLGNRVERLLSGPATANVIALLALIVATIGTISTIKSESGGSLTTEQVGQIVQEFLRVVPDDGSSSPDGPPAPSSEDSQD